jgi:hypothetical protein
MQFSGARNFWGKGLYFAEKSSYSHSYTYRPDDTTDAERGPGVGNEREMFLVKLLTGNVVLMDRDESEAKRLECAGLNVPPVDPATGQKFNTVTGHTAGSQVWVVYENGRAYPDYLIRYYRGAQDRSRTPFGSRAEARATVKIKKRSAMDKLRARRIDQLRARRLTQWENPLTRDVGDPLFIQPEPEPEPELQIAPCQWQYDNNGHWKAYDAAAQAALQAAQTMLMTNAGTDNRVNIKAGAFTYEVDIKAMTQTNITHPAHTQRKVRRLDLASTTTIAI